ncbi:MAPEG family protein [Candidatus Uabimicrobium sp. HlEnr_7]|uniref:MAPEG family protein n=1 Tax=Candidatus Uabimicrobium helgolandensis TaxID=3095367 RepID=UPI003557012E
MPITGFYTAILGIIIFLLMGNVIRYRRSEKIGLGHGENQSLLCAMRSHGNAIETIPICVLLLAMAELNQVSSTVVHCFGATLVVARILHPWGLLSNAGVTFGRFFGTILTFLTMIGLAGVILANVIPKIF